MPSTVTTSGEQFLNTVATGHTPLSGGLLADQILFANIDGLDHTQTPPITETVPETLVHTAQVTRASNLNADTAVFTTVLESHVGDFSFNWLGLYNSEYDVLIQVSYEPVQQKIATDGPTVGNVLAKGLALQVLGGQSVLNMQTATESWQFDFTGRQKAAEEIQRNAMRAVYGSGAYVTAAGSVTKGASVYQVAPGQAIIDGLRIDLPATDTAIASDNAPENYPFYVYAEVWQQVDSNAVTNHSAIVTSQTPLTDITDPGGNIRTRVLLATLDDENTITDAREYITDHIELTSDSTEQFTGLTRYATTQEHEQRSQKQAAATPGGVDELLSKMFAGQVSHFPSTVAPSGWLQAKGQTVNRSDYPYLWAFAESSGNIAVSDAAKTDGQFGPGDGSTTFSLPDLRGVHIRNWDDSKGTDSGRGIGSNQNDQNKSHSHEATTASAGSHSHGYGKDVQEATAGNTGAIYPGFSLLAANWQQDFTNRDTETTESEGSHSHTVTVNADGGTETRVKNIALMACIKY